MENFIFYFLSGNCEKSEGNSVSEAFSKLGYGSGAVSALDFYDQSNDQEYQWHGTGKGWIKEINK